MYIFHDNLILTLNSIPHANWKMISSIPGKLSKLFVSKFISILKFFQLKIKKKKQKPCESLLTFISSLAAMPGPWTLWFCLQFPSPTWNPKPLLPCISHVHSYSTFWTRMRCAASRKYPLLPAGYTCKDRPKTKHSCILPKESNISVSIHPIKFCSEWVAFQKLPSVMKSIAAFSNSLSFASHLTFSYWELCISPS